jgi:hypothetical protein
VFVKVYLKQRPEKIFRGRYLPKVIGKGLDQSTVLVFPPGKSWHASSCAFRLRELAFVYFAWAVERAGARGSNSEEGDIFIDGIE